IDSERLLHVGIVASIEVIRQLRLEVASIHNDEDRGVVQCRVSPELLTSEDHGERLARALSVPDEAGAILGGRWTTRERDRSVYQLVHRLELLIARDLLDRLTLLRLKDDEVLNEVEHVRGLQPQQ